MDGTTRAGIGRTHHSGIDPESHTDRRMRTPHSPTTTATGKSLDDTTRTAG